MARSNLILTTVLFLISTVSTDAFAARLVCKPKSGDTNSYMMVSTLANDEIESIAGEFRSSNSQIFVELEQQSAWSKENLSYSSNYTFFKKDGLSIVWFSIPKNFSTLTKLDTVYRIRADTPVGIVRVSLDVPMGCQVSK